MSSAGSYAHTSRKGIGNRKIVSGGTTIRRPPVGPKKVQNGNRPH